MTTKAPSATLLSRRFASSAATARTRGRTGPKWSGFRGGLSGCIPDVQMGSFPDDGADAGSGKKPGLRYARRSGGGSHPLRGGRTRWPTIEEKEIPK